MFVLLALLACHGRSNDGQPADSASPELGPRPEGDADAGWDLLRYGDYVGAGVPADLWFELIGEVEGNELAREGRAADLSPAWNLFESPEGAEVVGGVACFGCHGSWIDGRFIPGLGDAFSDYTQDRSSTFGLVLGMVKARYGEDSAEYAATARFVRGAEAMSPYIVLPFAGINPAFSMERSAAAWRDPETLEWQDAPLYEVPDNLPFSDVPPWWTVQKKEALFYNGMGRGDFARLIQQIGVVALVDRAHAEQIDQDFGDVLAWIRSLEPPPWPGDIDEALAEQGAAVFEASCARCHGTYGEEETFPALRVAVDEVGTDPFFAEEAADPDFNAWLSASWYGEGDWGGEFDADLGYVAPPLDGVWATAPYLHNGSVPDLVALLDSSQRPAAWWRDFESSSYDYERVGWPWEAAEADGDPWTYDTSVQGGDNGGHTYSDALSADERSALLEYLKTL